MIIIRKQGPLNLDIFLLLTTSEQTPYLYFFLVTITESIVEPFYSISGERIYKYSPKQSKNFTLTYFSSRLSEN